MTDDYCLFSNMRPSRLKNTQTHSLVLSSFCLIGFPFDINCKGWHGHWRLRALIWCVLLSVQALQHEWIRRGCKLWHCQEARRGSLEGTWSLGWLEGRPPGTSRKCLGFPLFLHWGSSTLGPCGWTCVKARDARILLNDRFHVDALFARVNMT